MNYSITVGQTVQLQCPWNPGSGIPEVKYHKVFTNFNIPQTDSIKGYLEHLPLGYNPSDVSTKYPIVIVLHVLGEFGPGTPQSMCDFFQNKWQYFPYTRIEGSGMPWPATLQTEPGVNTRFITLTPQFIYDRYTPTNVEDFIEFVKQTYNINERKIYLVGTSQGANVALQYIGKSVANARSIAGVLALSPCYNIKQQEVENIKNGKVSVWTLQCHNDLGCGTSIYDRENDTIAAYNNYQKLKAAGINEYKNVISLMNSSTGCGANAHDSWSSGLNTTFTYSSLPSPMNVYQWLGALNSDLILPVKLKSFDVKSIHNKVVLTWNTSREENGEYFYIQRANNDHRFSTIDSVLTKNNPNGASYQYTDSDPLKGNNYYRLLQKDTDGKIQTFEIKRITVSVENLITITNNPFSQSLKFSIRSITNNQYQIIVRDIHGKIYHQQSIFSSIGNTNFDINSAKWPKGIYFLSYQNNQNIETTKLIKQ